MLNIKLRAIGALILLILFLLGIIGFIVDISLPVWIFFAVIGIVSFIILTVGTVIYIAENPEDTIEDFLYN